MNCTWLSWVTPWAARPAMTRAAPARSQPLQRTNVKTQPYPGFPTDMQPQMGTLLCLAQGTSVITEGIYDNRFKYVNELRKMGAEIQVDGRVAVIEGGTRLTGELYSFYMYIAQVLMSVLMVAMCLLNLTRASACAQRIDEILEAQPDICDGAVPENQLPASSGKVEFKNVSFRYKAGSGDDVLKNINLTVEPGEFVAIIGATGTGKSTLGYAITGNPEYTVTAGKIVFDGEDITRLPVNERAKKGVFLSFQNPLEVPGVTLSAFIRSALEQKTGKRIRLWDFKKKLAETMQLLAMDASYAERDLNVGFSGGEKKKAEILQMLMLEPKLAILDETDSGLDVDAVRTVSKGVQLYREHVHGSLLIITHSTRILEALTVDAAHIMEQGVIVKNGDASLVDTINENGFGGIRAD